LYLCAKWESDPLFQIEEYQYLDEIAPPPQAEQIGLAAVFSALHFKTARQDQVLEKGKTRTSSDDGAVLVDSIFIDEVEGERWCIGYTTSEIGAARFNNNRFNVQALAPIKSIPKEVRRLSRNTYEWIQQHWKEERSVWLVSVPTGIAEAPYRIALTSVSPADRDKPETKARLKRSRQDFYDSASSLADRSFPSTPGQTALLYDLGWRRVNQIEGQLRANTSVIRCEAIDLTYESERIYLSEHLSHYVRRVRALNSKQYLERYSLIGTYTSLVKPIAAAKLREPWAWNVTTKGLTLRQGDSEYILTCRQPVTSWRTPKLSALIFGARIPNASVRAWTHKSSAGAKTGQVTATDGSNFWLFQSTSRVGYIGADEVSHYAKNGGKKVIKTPVVIRHAQHQNPISPLNEKFIKRIRNIPYTRTSSIPTTSRARLEAIENFQIAIPTYGRSGMIADFTLKMLARYKVDPKRVTIFVADAVTEKLWVEKGKRGQAQVHASDELESKADPQLYRERLKNNPYGQRIVVGVKNIGSQRNFIQNHYPEGTHLISMDDDLVRISALYHDKYREIRGPKEFSRIVENGFMECHSTGSHLWGMYASANEKFQSTALENGEISHANNYIIASFYGKIIRHDKFLEVESINHAEDQERSLRFFAKDGVLVRLNRYTMSKGSEYFAKGGLEQARRADVAMKKAPFEESIRRVALTFPTLCKPYVKKRTKRFPYGYWDLRFRRHKDPTRTPR
jgi:hypothetical protein